MKILTLIISQPSMIQKKFQLEVWNLIKEKSTVISIFDGLVLKGQQSSFGEKQRKRVSELLYVTRILLEAIVLASFNYIHCPRSASHSFIHFPQSGLSGFCT